jgi:hypothetical protein
MIAVAGSGGRIISGVTHGGGKPQAIQWPEMDGEEVCVMCNHEIYGQYVQTHDGFVHENCLRNQYQALAREKSSHA